MWLSVEVSGIKFDEQARGGKGPLKCIILSHFKESSVMEVFLQFINIGNRLPLQVTIAFSLFLVAEHLPHSCMRN